MSLTFPSGASLTDGATVTASNITWTYSAAKGVWQNNVIGLTGAFITVGADSGTADPVTLGVDTLTIAGGTGLTSTVSDNQVSLSLDSTAVSAGSYGSASLVPVITVDAQGRITNVSTTATSSALVIGGDSGSDDTLTVGTDTLTIAGGTGLTSTVSDNQVSLALDNTAVTAATYGGSGTIPQITVDAQGRITAVASIPTSNFQITTSILSASSILNSTSYGIKVLGNTNWVALGATSTTVSSGNLVVGREYVISSLGNTTAQQWTLVGGDAAAQVGEIFKCTLVGGGSFGSGTVLDTIFTSTSTAATNAAATGTGKIALDTQHYVTFVDGTSGTSTLLVSDQLKYNPGTGAVTADNLNGSFIGKFAGVFSGTLDSSVAAGIATTVTITQNDTASQPSGDKLFLTMVDERSGIKSLQADTRLYYDDDDDALVSNAFSGPLEGAVTGNITGDVLASGDSSVIVDSSEKAFIGDLTGDVKASGGAVIIDSSANTVTTTKVIGNLYSANDILILDKGTTANTAVFTGTVKGDLTDLNGASIINQGSRIVTADKFVGDVYASNGSSKVLESGTNGTNATFTGAVVGNVTGDIYDPTGSTKILENGTDGTDAVFTGNVTGNVNGAVTGNVNGNVLGNLTGDILQADGTKILENGPSAHFTGDVTGNIAGNVKSPLNSAVVLNASTGALTGTVTGNAGSATVLATARTIGGVSFDGSADISLPGVNTAGNQSTSGNANSATLAAKATRWDGTRTVSMTGAVTTTAPVNWDGTGALTLNTQINSLGAVTLGTGTQGAYVATIADAGSSRITVGGTPASGTETAAVTLDITDNAIGTDQIAANAVTLGTKTSGDYVATVTGTTNEIELSTASTTEGRAVTIGLPNDVTIGNNLTVTGNLTINGASTTIDTTTLSVEDPLIILASGNSSSDSVDIGFYGLYDTSGSQDLYSGMFRDANDSGKWKLFKDNQAAPTTTVNVSGTGYTKGTLVADFEGQIKGNLLTAQGNNAVIVDDGSSGANQINQLVGRADRSTTIRTTADTTTNSNIPILFGQASGTSETQSHTRSVTGTFYTPSTSSALHFNPSTGTLSATTFIGNISGSSASASSIGITAANTTTGSHFITFVDASGTGTRTVYSDTGLSYVPSTDTLTVTNLTGTATQSVNLTNHDTDGLSEGSTNLYYTDARARDSVDGTTGISYDSSTGDFSLTDNGSSNWNTAYSWGNHASAGYLTSVGFSDLASASVLVSTETFVDSDTQIMTAKAINDRIEAFGYSTTTGTVTTVTAGTNLSGGGSGSTVTINLADSAVYGLTEDMLVHSNHSNITAARVGDEVRLTGTASASDMAINSTLTNTDHFFLLASSNSGSQPMRADSAIKFNTTTDTLTSTKITATDTVTFGSLSDGTITATAFVDEDNMSSDSATLIPTQQSVKAYVDAQVATKDNTDEMTEGSTNLYFTNARADARITNALVDEDNMASNSATKVPSQQSVKAYVDAQVGDSDLDFQGDAGGALSIDLDSETLTIAGGTGLSTAGSGNTLTVALEGTAVSAGQYGSGTQIPQITVDAQGRITAATEITASTSVDASTTVKGIASFDTNHFVVTSGAVTIKTRSLTSTDLTTTAGITSSQLASVSGSGGSMTGGIQTNKIGYRQVLNDNLGAGSVHTSTLGTNVVSADKLQANAVTEVKIADDAVTHDKIVDNAVDGDKLADNIDVAGNLTVEGNLIVNGTQTDLNVTTLTVDDVNIGLAVGNTAGDSKDFGIYGNYKPGGTGPTLSAGLFRDASTEKWRLYQDIETSSPNDTIALTTTGYTKSTLVADLEGTADLADEVTVTHEENTNATYYIPFVDGYTTGSRALLTDAPLTYNPLSNRLTAGNINGTFFGSVTGNLVGNVTGNISGGVTGNVSGNAGSAGILQNSQDFIVGSTTISFNGSSAVDLTTAVRNQGSYYGTSQKLEATNTGIEVTGHIIPSAHESYDLGSPTRRFRKGYFDEGTIYLGTQELTADSSGISVSGNFSATNITGTLTGNATGTSATLATARNITVGAVDHAFNGSADIDLTEAIQDTVGAMFSSNTETNITATYQDADGTIDLVASGGGGSASGLSAGGSAVTVSETAPGSPSNGALWFDSSSLTPYTYYNDGSSSQWVQFTPGGGITSTPNAVVNISETAVNNPTAGDLWFDPSDMTPYLYYNDGNSSQWVNFVTASGGGGSAASVLIQETAPSTPGVGDLWFDPSDLTPYMYYNDGTSSQWVNFVSGMVSGSGSGGGGGSLTIAADSGTADVVTVGTDTITFAGGTGIDTTVSNNNISIVANAAYINGLADARITAADTGALSEGSNLYYTEARADARITAALIDEDNMSSDSATRLPSQQSVKAYVDAQASDVVDDTTPQLGGALDVNGQDIISVSNGDIELDPNGSGVVIFKGNATKGAGQFKLNCENNSHGITIKGPPHSAGASYTLTLPNDDGASGQVLLTDGNGVLSWGTPPASGTGVETLRQNGLVTVNTGVGRWYVPAAAVITKIVARVNTAPSGAAMNLVINKVSGGSTTTTALAIAAGAVKAENNSPSLSLSYDDYITVDVTQVGSSEAGRDLQVIFTYTY
jgi:hypothetical protein